MSMPNIPDIEPKITIDKEKAIDLLLASVALEELSLAHMINAGAEEIQFLLGTLVQKGSGDDNADDDEPKEPATLTDLLKLNKSIERLMKKVIIKDILLGFKLDNILDLVSSLVPADEDGNDEGDTDVPDETDETDETDE